MTGLAAATPHLASRLAAYREAGIVALLMALVAGVSLAEPTFFSARTLNQVLLWAPLLVVVGVGQMMVIITRGIDVSVGSTLGLTGILVGMAFRDYPQVVSPAVGVALSVAIGAVLGAFNGLLVAVLRVPPVIATLGTLNAYRGLTFIVSGGAQVSSDQLPRSMIAWPRETILGLPFVTPMLVFPVVIALAGWLVLSWTRAGRAVYAVGGNPEAAALRGLPTRRVLFAAYTACGALAGLAGVLYAARYGFINPSQTGLGFELTVIAAVVIGGASIFGGTGSVGGMVLGCLLLGVINVALSALGIEGKWQLAVYGALILVAVIVDDLLLRRLRREESR